MKNKPIAAIKVTNGNSFMAPAPSCAETVGTVGTPVAADDWGARLAGGTTVVSELVWTP